MDFNFYIKHKFLYKNIITFASGASLALLEPQSKACASLALLEPQGKACASLALLEPQGKACSFSKNQRFFH